MPLLQPGLRLLTRASLSLSGWTIEGRFPEPRRFVVIGAPHTSWVDFWLTMALIGRFGIRLRWLAKESLFRGPLGPIMRGLGGLSVDRSASTGLVEALAERFRQDEELVIAISPEGTRRRTERWRSGFYRIALQAGVPIVPVRVEAQRKALHIGPPLEMSGDLERDVARLADFYEPARGILADRFGPVRWE